ncbi:MAG: hypothetical protein ABIP93_11800 [Gemmatimonadaceae bacterium]
MRLATALVVLLAVPIAAQAQDRWRSFDVSRQLHDTVPQRIRVQYGAGRVDVRGTDEPLLYGMHLRYDEQRSAPLHRHDAEQHSTVLGLESRHGVRPSSSGESESGELKVLLPSRIPLELELQFGGTEAMLELGGLALHSVRLECGATDATLGFSQPNRARMRELEVSVGAAGFTALHLANANADLIRVRGGVGVVDLDFSGSWKRDLAVESRVAIGKLMLRVPEDVGVRVEIQRVAAGFDHEGLVKRDDAWYSRNWDTATHRLRIRAESVFGGISVQRSTR